MSFFMGMFGGMASSVDKALNESFDDLDKRLGKLSDRTLNKLEIEKPRFDAEFRENDQKVQYLANQLNINGGTKGMEVLHSLIQQETWAGAQAMVPDIVKKLKLNGLKAGDTYLPIADYNVDGKRIAPSSKQLAEQVTVPMAIPNYEGNMSVALQGSGLNLLNFITRGEANASNYAKNYIQTDLALAGYSKEDLAGLTYGELPPALQIDVDKFDLLLGESMENDLKLITGRIDNLMNAGENENKEEIDELTKEKNNLTTIIANTVKGDFTETNTRNTVNTTTEQISARLGVELVLNPNGIGFQSYKGKVENFNTAVAAGVEYGSLAEWAHSTNPETGGRASTTSSHKPLRGASARGFLTEDQIKFFDANAKKFVTKSGFGDENAYEPNRFLSLAAINGMRVKKITRAMIAENPSLDLNHGEAYMVMDGMYPFDDTLRKDPKKNIVGNDNNTGNDETNTDTVFRELTTKFADIKNDNTISKKKQSSLMGLQARKIRNFILDNNPGMPKDQIDIQWKRMTNNTPWESKWGSLYEKK